MLGEISHDTSNTTNCNQGKDFNKLFLIGQQFSKQIAHYNISQCKRKFTLLFRINVLEVYIKIFLEQTSLLNN